MIGRKTAGFSLFEMLLVGAAIGTITIAITLFLHNRSKNIIVNHASLQMQDWHSALQFYRTVENQWPPTLTSVITEKSLMDPTDLCAPLPGIAATDSCPINRATYQGEILDSEHYQLSLTLANEENARKLANSIPNATVDDKTIKVIVLPFLEFNIVDEAHYPNRIKLIGRQSIYEEKTGDDMVTKAAVPTFETNSFGDLKTRNKLKNIVTINKDNIDCGDNTKIIIFPILSSWNSRPYPQVNSNVHDYANCTTQAEVGLNRCITSFSDDSCNSQLSTIQAYTWYRPTRTDINNRWINTRSLCFNKGHQYGDDAESYNAADDNSSFIPNDDYDLFLAGSPSIPFGFSVSFFVACEPDTVAPAYQRFPGSYYTAYPKVFHDCGRRARHRGEYIYRIEQYCEDDRKSPVLIE